MHNYELDPELYVDADSGRRAVAVSHDRHRPPAVEGAVDSPLIPSQVTVKSFTSAGIGHTFDGELNRDGLTVPVAIAPALRETFDACAVILLRCKRCNHLGPSHL